MSELAISLHFISMGNILLEVNYAVEGDNKNGSKTRVYTTLEIRELYNSNLADMFEISRPTAYKYIKKYEENGIVGLLDDARGPRFPHI